MEEFYILGFGGKEKLEMPCSPGECCILPQIKIHPYCPYWSCSPSTATFEWLPQEEQIQRGRYRLNFI